MLRHRAPLIVGSLLIVAMVAYVSLYRSSPGDLARGHQAVAGSRIITDCKKCHAEKGLAWACLQCHTEIQTQLSQGRGYHAYLAEQKKTECAKCHSDHNGLDFQMVNPTSWEGQDLKNFKHPGKDYRLTGRHLTTACEKCHAAKTVKPFSLPRFPNQKRSLTYLGLSQDCVSCHADPHAHGLVTACASCHDQAAWKPAPLFNHDKLFPLRGAHASLKCDQCHSPEHRVAQNPFGKTHGKECLDCHQNSHRTRWAEGCQSCHKSDDMKWSGAEGRMTKAQHAATGFHLSIPHNKTRCAGCHDPALAFNAKYPDPHKPGYNRFEKNCESCHQDTHNGQFVKTHPRCVECHTLTAFLPPAFGAKEHKTYPLIGGHLKAACNDCHRKDSPSGVRLFVPMVKTCSACHKDIHYGQFRKPNGKTNCEECHRTAEAWEKIVFDHETQSRFKLGEAHAKVACKECHPRVTVRGVTLVQYKPIRFLCSDCHQFEHR